MILWRVIAELTLIGMRLAVAWVVVWIAQQELAHVYAPVLEALNHMGGQ
jgi:hypothetical protein